MYLYHQIFIKSELSKEPLEELSICLNILKCILFLKLKYSWFTMLCSSLMYSEMIQSYICCLYVLSHLSCVWLCNAMDCSPSSSSVHWDSPGKNAGVGFHALLQGIFLTQGLNLCLLWLLHYRLILYHRATGDATRENKYIYIYTFFTILFSFMIYHRILNIVL